MILKMNNKIGYGTAGKFGTDESHVDLLKFALDCGITFFDTAENYQNGKSEETIGKAFKNNRDQVFISTKVSPENLNYNNLINAAENSLNRLQTDYIDLYQLHWPNPQVKLSESLDALVELKKQGKIRNIGLSNFTPIDLIHAWMDYYEIDYMQNEYNLFDRTLETNLIKDCKDNNIKFIAYSPLDKGRQINDPLLIEIAKKYNKSVVQIILKWITRHEHVIAIPATLSKKYIEENSKLDFILEEEDIKNINLAYKWNLQYIMPDEIYCAEYKENEFFPSPEFNAEYIKTFSKCSTTNHHIMKPIRVELNSNNKYVVSEGKSRYWSWKLAFDSKEPIPCLVRGIHD